MEVKQVGFEPEKFVAKCGAVADVSDGIEAFVSDACPGNVDTILGNELFVAREIDGGHSVFRSVAAAPAGGTENAEGTREKMTRPAHAAGAEQFANLAAGNTFAAQLHLG